MKRDINRIIAELKHKGLTIYAKEIEKEVYRVIARKLPFSSACDRLRRDECGEKFWQKMMNSKRKISELQFLNAVDLKDLLDDDETWQEYKQGQSDRIDYYESDNAYFFQTAGFEFIWKK